MSSYQLHEPPRDAPPARLGRYELIGHLATGGMAEIHLARLAGEAGFEKIVVVKRLLPELVASRAFVTMFLDEGKLVSRLDHPNICEVHELGRDGAEYFLAMPFLDGVLVHELIARPREPDRLTELRICAGIITQACAGLHHAHELRDADGTPANLVHRDVSPSNLFVTAAGTVKVLDFGVAKVRGAAETEAGTIKGKTQYMAPEQLLGEPLDRRADVFALGIVLFELATHQRLFKRASDYLVAKAILEEPSPRADVIDPAIPASVADVIANALARSPAARYATASELAAALEASLASHGGIAPASLIAAAVTATDELSAMRTRQHRVLAEARSRISAVAPAAPASPAAPAAPASPAANIASQPPPSMSSPLARRATWPAAIAAIAGVVVVGGVVGVLAFRGDDAPPTRESAIAAAPPSTSIDAAAARVDQPDAALPIQVAAPIVDAAPPVALHVDAAPPPNTQRPAARRGTISIDSTPFATIFIDGKRVDVTPLLGYSLLEGRHTIRAVLEDGRAKDFPLDVRASKATKPVVLTW